MIPEAAGEGLDRFPSIHTSDLDMARAAFGRAYGDLSLDVSDARKFDWRAHFVDLGPITMSPSVCHGEVTLRGATKDYVFHVLRRGHVQAATRGSRAEIAGGDGAVLYSPTGPSEWKNDGDSAGTALRIDPGFLVTQLEALTGVTVHRPPELALHVRTDVGAGAGLDRLCQFMLAEVEQGSDALTHPAVMTSLCEALARGLLLGHPHDHAHLLEKPAPTSSKSVVRLVEEYLEAHADEPLGATELTALTGASVRSIEAAFRAHRGSTLAIFLRGKRLDRARQRLLAPEPDATVTAVAHASGFLRRARFDAAYSEQFGESPVETLRRGLIAVERPSSSRRPTLPSAPGWPVVLVAGNAPSRLEVVAAPLREAGHAVEMLTSPQAFFAAAGSATAGCAVLDLRTFELDSLGVQATLGERGRALPLVFIAGDTDARAAVEAMKDGAVDVLLEPVDRGDLLAAVARALARDAEARAALAAQKALAAQAASLSPREREVCERAARGMLNKQIAAELGISERVEKQHRASGMAKLGVGSTAELGALFERLRRASAGGL
jgi:FixJ family two-component response regulator/AraC-like DNA-binding protein